jgi:hypothetical protein
MLEALINHFLPIQLQKTMRLRLILIWLQVFGRIPQQLTKSPFLPQVARLSNTQPPIYMESKMPNPTRIQIDCSTGIESIIELTDAEVAELTYQAELAAEKKVEEEAEAAAKAEAKAALLDRLGISAEEAQLLLA